MLLVQELEKLNNRKSQPLQSSAMFSAFDSLHVPLLSIDAEHTEDDEPLLKAQSPGSYTHSPAAQSPPRGSAAGLFKALSPASHTQSSAQMPPRGSAVQHKQQNTAQLSSSCSSAVQHKQQNAGQLSSPEQQDLPQAASQQQATSAQHCQDPSQSAADTNLHWSSADPPVDSSQLAQQTALSDPKCVLAKIQGYSCHRSDGKLLFEGLEFQVCEGKAECQIFMPLRLPSAYLWFILNACLRGTQLQQFWLNLHLPVCTFAEPHLHKSRMYNSDLRSGATPKSH